MGSDWLPFGTLGRAHGTRGEIHLRVHSGAPPELAVPCPLRLQGADGGVEVTLVAARRVPDGYLVRLQGIADREAAAGLAGRSVELHRACLPALGEAEFYVEDVVGCEVLCSDGRRLGRVAGTFWNGAQDVMTVVGDDGVEHLLPVVPEYVIRVDGKARRVIVDPHD